MLDPDLIADLDALTDEQKDEVISYLTGGAHTNLITGGGPPPPPPGGGH